MSNQPIPVRIAPELLVRLDAAANRWKVTRSELIRMAVSEFVAKRPPVRPIKPDIDLVVLVAERFAMPHVEAKVAILLGSVKVNGRRERSLTLPPDVPITSLDLDPR